MEIIITPRNAEKTVSFAGEELHRYLARMLAGEEGVFSVFLGVRDGAEEKMDSYSVSVTGSGGRILGSNPRSVLLGVYDYLRRLGCRFLGPGKAMEVVPHIRPGDLPAEYARKASTGACALRARTLPGMCWTLLTGFPRWAITAFFSSFRCPMCSWPGGITMT